MRYFARRLRPTIRRPCKLSAKAGGKGKRRSARRNSTRKMRAPTRTGARPRRTVSTSGNSGISSPSFLSVSAIDSHGRAAALWSARFGEWIKMQDAQSPGSTQDAGSSQNGEASTHFGYSQVPLGEKQGLVDDVFHKVAHRYDMMNDLMSGGLHRVWKDVLVGKAHPSRRPPFNHLDVAGGTGDVAFRVARAGGPQTRVTVLDINGDMLAVGRDRAEKKGLG